MLRRVSVTPARYGIRMTKQNTPNTRSDQAIEAFFAHMGLAVEVVDRCPIASCEHCRIELHEAA